MPQFAGGSAYSMSHDIAEGYVLLSRPTLRKHSRSDLMVLQAEMEKTQREIRAEQPPLDDLAAIQRKNRRIQRLQQALLLLRNHLASEKP